jgi:hypothetical protein
MGRVSNVKAAKPKAGSAHPTTVSFDITFSTTDSSLDVSLGDCKGANDCLSRLVELTMSELIESVSSNTLAAALASQPGSAISSANLKVAASISMIHAGTVLVTPPACTAARQDFEQTSCCGLEQTGHFVDQNTCNTVKDVFDELGCCLINKEMQQRGMLGVNNVPRTVVWTEPPNGSGSGQGSR